MAYRFVMASVLPRRREALDSKYLTRGIISGYICHGGKTEIEAKEKKA